MDMMRVQSTNIWAVGYDQTTSTMRVQFSGGLVYEYANVSPDVYAHMTSGDIGSYFASIVKPQRWTMPFVKLGIQPLAGSGTGSDTDTPSDDTNAAGYM